MASSSDISDASRRVYSLELGPYRRRLAARPDADILSRPGMQIMDLNGHRVRIRMAGEGSHALVFAADSPVLIEHHDALFRLLTPHVAVVCLDMPGFGFSSPPADFGFTRGEYADLVQALLHQLPYDTVSLVFPCFTSYVAMEVASREPDLVTDLVFAQAPDWAGELAWFRLTGGLFILHTPVLGQLFLTMLHTVVPRVWLAPWFRLTLPASPADRAWIERETMAGVRRGMVNCWSSIYQAWDALPAPDVTLQQPCLSLWGDCDHTHFRTDMRSMTRLVPHARFTLFEGAGHYSYLQQPERFAALILERLSAL